MGNRQSFIIRNLIDSTVHLILSGKPTGKRPLQRCRRKWKDNIRIDLKEIGITKRNLIYLTLDGGY